MACFIWNVARDHRGSVVARLLRFVAESAWQLWPGRGIHPCKREGFWAWRSARYHGRNRCCAQKISDRQQSPRCDRLELWRVHDDVDGDADKSLSRSCGRRRYRQLAKLLWPELDRSMDDPIFRRNGLRRPCCLPEEFTD